MNPVTLPRILSGLETDMDDWTEYERRKKELPLMDPEEYTEEVKGIAEELGL